MSDYNVTSAASTEAAHRDMDPGPTGENNRAWFVAGAEWGHDQALAQEPTDAECIAILNAVTTPFGEKVQNHEWAYAGIQRCREAIMDARRKEYK